MVILDVALMALITTAIFGLLVWSILTQHRDPRCAHLRVRQRLYVSVRFVTLPEPKQAELPQRIQQRGLVI
jgi:hypothetical protein